MRIMTILIFLLMFFLVSCTTKVTSIKQDQISVLGEDKGYVLLGIQTNRDLKSIQIDGPQTISLSSSDIKKGTNYLLVDLKAGIYTIKRIRIGYYAGFRLDNKDYWSFEVKPNQVSYVGHLEIVQRGYFYLFAYAELVNRASEAIEFLENKFPNILSEYNLAYSGPGTDYLFEYLASDKKE
jgi:hypothetical protein